MVGGARKKGDTLTGKILLTTVFKPFAVDDMFSRCENIPELMMAQITRVQGIFSYRAWHANAGLHLIAANSGGETTVLEWPSREEFIAAITSITYEYIGISFIPSTFSKMREMVRLVRVHAPHSKIVIGGHGVMLDGIEELVDVNYVCQGDGIRFLRHITGAPPEFTFNHPVVKSSIVEYLGIPIPFMQTGQIVTGLGCRYGCEFCVTSAFYNCVYQPFLMDGRELCRLMVSHYKNAGIKNFWFIDENFLSEEERARAFIAAASEYADDVSHCSIDMLWSTADMVARFTPEELAILGVTKIWMGYESMFSVYRKNRNIDFKQLISDLARYGISVLLSCTAFSDDHDEALWQQEVDAFITMGQAYSQFLPLTAFPGTPLYKRLKKEGRLLDAIPPEERHALTTSCHQHPSIPIWKQESLIIHAYQQEYQQSGPGHLRDTKNRITGYRTMSTSTHPVLIKRAAHLYTQLASQAPWILACREFVEEGHQSMVDEMATDLEEILGVPKFKECGPVAHHLQKLITRSLATRKICAAKEREPGLRVTRYDGVHAEPLEVCNPKRW